METLALLWLLVPYLGFASQSVGDRVRRFFRRQVNHLVLMLGALLVPYLLMTAPGAQRNLSGFANGLLAMAAYVFVPGALAFYRQKAARPRPLDLADALTIPMLWLPVEFGWLPAVSVRVAGLDVSLSQLTGVALTLLIFLVIRPLAQIGYTFMLTARDLRRAGIAALAFAVVAIPLGLLTGFIAWRPPAGVYLDVLIVRFVGVFFLVALPEELLFRGIIQNLIEKRYAERNAALIVAAILFGAAHLNDALAPNYLYALLSVAAGVAYGWVWMHTRKITAAALAHTLVNWVWVVLFGG